MKFKVIDTGIFTIDHFMDKVECENWITFSESEGYELAKINMGWGSQVVNTQIRNNERLIYDAPALAIDLWPRIEPFVAKETSAGLAIGLNERFRFYKYFPGQQFKPHRDGIYFRNEDEWSSYTFMIYLNDTFEGGETKFNKCSIQPATGKALIFRHELLHEGCPVITGIKYVLRTDIMYRRK